MTSENPSYHLYGKRDFFHYIIIYLKKIWLTCLAVNRGLEIYDISGPLFALYK